MTMSTLQRFLVLAATAAGGACAWSQTTQPADWPQFRGPGASGVADGRPLPTRWRIEVPAEGPARLEGVAWRTPIPGLAHSSPVVVGDRVYVTTATPESGETSLRVGLYGDGDSAEDMEVHAWKLYCLDRRTGAVLWQRTATSGVPSFKRHTKATHCNSTPAASAEAVVAFFGAEGLFCFSPDGELRWQVDLGPLDVGPHNAPDLQWGFASSPIIADGKVIVQCDVKQGAFLAALRLEDGGEVWRVSRGDVPGWCTPTACLDCDPPQLVVNGCREIGGYDLRTGARLWQLAGGGGIPVPAPVLSQGVAFLTSNHRPIRPSDPQKPVFAVRLDARGEIPVPAGETVDPRLAWFVAGRGNYMQTPVVYRGVVYLCADNGTLTALDQATGAELFRERIGPGAAGFSASGVAGDGKLYFTSEEGDVVVLEAARTLKVLEQNTLGEICMATPAVSDGVLYFRTRGHVVAVDGRSEVSAAP